MTLPTRPIEDVVADLRALTYVQRSRRENVAALNEAADLLLSQDREVAEGRAVLALHQQALDEGFAVNKALQKRLEAVEGALAEIAKGEAPPQPHGHYLAHRACVDLARKALSAIQPVGGE